MKLEQVIDMDAFPIGDPAFRAKCRADRDIAAAVARHRKRITAEANVAASKAARREAD